MQITLQITIAGCTQDDVDSWTNYVGAQFLSMMQRDLDNLLRAHERITKVQIVGISGGDDAQAQE